MNRIPEDSHSRPTKQKLCRRQRIGVGWERTVADCIEPSRPRCSGNSRRLSSCHSWSGRCNWGCFRYSTLCFVSSEHHRPGCSLRICTLCSCSSCWRPIYSYSRHNRCRWNRHNWRCRIPNYPIVRCRCMSSPEFLVAHC